MLKLVPLLAVLLLHATGPVANVAPAITGSLQQGRQLTVTPGTWTGAGAVAYAYQWYRCDAGGSHCSSIHGATGASYKQVARDVGGTLSAAVTATDSTGTTRLFAPLAGIVAPAGATLLPLGQPPILGTATAGQVVTVAHVRWNQAGATPTFAWLRCNAAERLCVPIDGASAASYTVTTDDVGSTLVATVSAAQATVLSLPTAVVAAPQGPALAGRPSVSGTLQQGQRLAARPGTWLGSGAITYAYQWYRCDANVAHCHSVHGATRGTYTLGAKDVGAALALTVRATDSTGTATAYAPSSGLVVAPSSVASTRQPVLTGKAAPGLTLAVKAGAWTAKPGKLTYSWLRCNPNGRACSGIAGAAGSRYVLTTDDRGHEVVAVVHTAAGTDVLTTASSLVS